MIIENNYATTQRNLLEEQEDLSNNMHLENYMITDISKADPVLQKGNSDMSSRVKKTYSYITKDGEEASVRFSGASDKIADMKFQQFILEQMAGSQRKISKSTKTVADFITNVYLPSFTHKLRPTTLANYRAYIDRYILPYIGSYTLDSLSIADVQSFMQELAHGRSNGYTHNLNKKTIDRVCGLCGRIFRIAVELGVTTNNPFKSAILCNPGKEASHHKAMPDAEIARIKRGIPTLTDREQQLFMGLLAYTGMRREEILGLRWEDINLPERYGMVHRSVTYPDRSKPHVDKTKSKSSERVILIAAPLHDILSKYYEPTGYILGGDKPLCYSTASRIARRAFKALNIINYNIHDFRTTFGTQMKESGLTSAQVADLLGHADTRMVETVYARTRQEGVVKNLGLIDRLNSDYVSPSCPQMQ